MNHFKTLLDAHRILRFPPSAHPPISVMTYDSTTFRNDLCYTSDFYLIGFKKIKAGVIQYGRTKYDHDRGSMSFIKPRQIVDMKGIELEEIGFIICFHEDFLIGHLLRDE